MAVQTARKRAKTRRTSAWAASICVLIVAIVTFGGVLRAIGQSPAQTSHTLRGASTPAAAAPSAATPNSLLFTQSACALVYAAPSATAPLITQLLGGTDVTLIDSKTPGWTHVRIWSHTDGYLASSALGATPPAIASEGDCVFPGVADPQPDVLPADNGPFPLNTQGRTTEPTALYAWPAASAPPVASEPIGAALRISQWASDGAGQPWYHVQAGASVGWLWSGAVRLDEPDPATHQVGGKPIWSAVAGTGMWFTNYQTRHADLARLVADAKAAGVTHIYAEVAISRWGFYAPLSLDRLLPVAHAQGIEVIAWVYPTLTNVAADARMTQQVASYRTPGGDHADGIATDVEETFDSASVYTYGQMIRGLFGPDTLLVDAAMHPFTHANYPYAAVAASWNVLAPMDFWHSRRSRVYTAQDVTAFVNTSVVTIRAAMQLAGVANPIPIEELGQTYDMYSQDGAGVGHNPTGAEITADLSAAKALGCIGASYFEWQTATQSQWDALSAFRW
ncbi:MAG: SH3 domain-containing protein [Ktedonobacterales bacterium]